MGALPLLKSPLLTSSQSKASDRQGEAVYEVADVTTQDETLFENFQFEHYEETSNIQLFFDLFFVANLTSFTNAHEINSLEKISSYIGFFCILWFTWVQVTLYDVRFATDSIIERVAHACHFGVMVGLAIIGPEFLTEDDGWGPLQQLSLILVVSRVVLFCQYGSTLLFTWRYRATRVPLVAVMVSLFIAVIIYLGISFAFYRRSAYDAYIAWYVVAVMEVAVNLGLAAQWRAMSFEKTHLVERLSCLTLIILGEGIIGLTKTIVKVETFDLKFTSADIGSIISAVLVIYLVYQLYFDNVRKEPFGSVRQQLWSILHFPFHLALALMMEGTNQILLCAHVVQDLFNLFNVLAPYQEGAPLEDMLTTLNETVYRIYERFPTTQVVIDEVEHALDTALNPAPNATEEQTLEEVQLLFREMAKTVIEGFGWEPPKEVEEGDYAGFGDSIVSIFNLTFAYFCICVGLVCMTIGVLTVLSHRPGYSRLRYISIGANILVGLGITLLSTMVLTDAAGNLGTTPWTLPALTLILLALLVLHHVSI
ncbi:bacterial low temperature requirement A protein-domain-containing protein [Aspergillus cavernicola]|uniref:Bacterial low temperature requirement A protein-domain-containing protein n=1 Tax=Aspergillus cavernicola TaxID=176166 RepID=A0ABR4IP08_9EURO